MSSEYWVGALVILYQGKLVGFKSQLAKVPDHLTMNSRHYRGFSPEDCTIETKEFHSETPWDDADAWVSSFPQQESGPPNLIASELIAVFTKEADLNGSQGRMQVARTLRWAVKQIQKRVKDS